MSWLRLSMLSGFMEMQSLHVLILYILYHGIIFVSSHSERCPIISFAEEESITYVCLMFREHAALMPFLMLLYTFTTSLSLSMSNY